MVKKSKQKTVLIAAGGTGGHIFPALVVAHKLQEFDVKIHWLGTCAGLEADIIPKEEIPISYLNISGFRGKRWQQKLLAPLMVSMSLLQAIFYLIKIKPTVVLGMGGYVTGPAGVAAYLLRKKLIIHEQNSIAGTTNKILSNFATKVLYAFPNAFPKKNSEKFVLTGNPVREKFKDLLSPDKRFARRINPLKILVLGGSRGAKALNECLVATMAKWQEGSNSVLPQIWHQTGAKLFQQTEALYKEHDLTRIKLAPFIEDMPAAYAWADLVIARAGALTIAELSAAGVGSILVPFPYAIDDHQTTNAEHLAENNAAIIIPQNELNPTKLLTILQGLVTNRGQLLSMANHAYSLNNKSALSMVVGFCKD